MMRRLCWTVCLISRVQSILSCLDCRDHRVRIRLDRSTLRITSRCSRLFGNATWEGCWWRMGIKADHTYLGRNPLETLKA
jgi:hypothetical protein